MVSKFALNMCLLMCAILMVAISGELLLPTIVLMWLLINLDSSEEYHPQIILLMFAACLFMIDRTPYLEITRIFGYTISDYCLMTATVTSLAVAVYTTIKIAWPKKVLMDELHIPKKEV